jgi:hypothetical protein
MWSRGRRYTARAHPTLSQHGLESFDRPQGFFFVVPPLRAPALRSQVRANYGRRLDAQPKSSGSLYGSCPRSVCAPGPVSSSAPTERPLERVEPCRSGRAPRPLGLSTIQHHRRRGATRLSGAARCLRALADAGPRVPARKPAAGRKASGEARLAMPSGRRMSRGCTTASTSTAGHGTPNVFTFPSALARSCSRVASWPRADHRMALSWMNRLGLSRARSNSPMASCGRSAGAQAKCAATSCTPCRGKDSPIAEVSRC